MTNRRTPVRARLGRFLRILFPRGTLVGALAFAGLFLYSVLTREGFSAFGIQDASIEKLVFGRFLGTVVSTQLQILGAYLAVGFVLGLGAGLVVRWAPRAFGRLGPRRFLARVLSTAALVLVFHFLTLARGIAEYPQLYAESFYDRGGARADLQVFLTELPVWVFDAVRWLLVAAAAALVCLGLWRDGLVAAWLRAVRSMRPLARRAWIASTAALALGAAAFVVWPVRAKGDGPNVLFIAVDSLRADRLTPYGASRPTPAIDSLAKGGTTFERAYVSLPRTFPSWTTLLSGQWPHRHGIRHMFPTRAERTRMPKTFVHALAQSGYQTSVVADYAGDIFPRADYGFQRISAPYFAFPTLIGLRSFELHKQLLPYVANALGRRVFPVLRELAQNADPRELGDRAIAELRHLAPRGKFFLTVFFSATHFPYAAPSPYYRLYAKRDYRGAFKYQKMHKLGRGERLDATDIQQIQDLYDGTVRSVDDQLARIFATLDDLGLEKNTIVVLLSDHGEHLHESGLGMGHGEHFRGDAALRIPLIVRGPGIAPGARVKSQVRDVDVVPTLSKLVGVAPLAPADGVDLAALWRGESADLGLDLYGETGLWFVDDGDEFFQKQRIPYPALTQLGRLDRDDEIVLNEKYADLVLVAKHRVLQTATHKLIYIPTRDGVRYELYDLVADPTQVRDVAAERPDLVRTLSAKLMKWMLATPGVVERRGFVVPAPKNGAPAIAQESGRGGPGG